MIKTFMLWMEDQNDKQRLIRIFLDRLHFDKHALDAGGDQVITDKKQVANILDIIKSMDGIDDDNKKQLSDFAMTHQNNLSLKALTNLINPVGGEVQDRAYSKPAVLPQAQQPAPRPLNNQQRMAQQAQQPQMPMPGMQ
jgi:hypothetical protein